MSKHFNLLLRKPDSRANLYWGEHFLKMAFSDALYCILDINALYCIRVINTRYIQLKRKSRLVRGLITNHERLKSLWPMDKRHWPNVEVCYSRENYAKVWLSTGINCEMAASGRSRCIECASQNRPSKADYYSPLSVDCSSLCSLRARGRNISQMFLLITLGGRL